tara:strand:+ start:1672 stop:2019 length:348 start_codon:yes stop_codon:yes gene_type:complete
MVSDVLLGELKDLARVSHERGEQVAQIFDGAYREIVRLKAENERLQTLGRCDGLLNKIVGDGIESIHADNQFLIKEIGRYEAAMCLATELILVSMFGLVCEYGTEEWEDRYGTGD